MRYCVARQQTRSSVAGSCVNNLAPLKSDLVHNPELVLVAKTLVATKSVRTKRKRAAIVDATRSINRMMRLWVKPKRYAPDLGFWHGGASIPPARVLSIAT